MNIEALDQRNVDYIHALASRQNIERARVACNERLSNASGTAREHWMGAKTVLGHVLRLNDHDRKTLLTSEWRHLHGGVKELLQSCGEASTEAAVREKQARQSIAMVDSEKSLTLDRTSNTIVDGDGKLVARLDAHSALNVRLSEKTRAMADRVLLGDLQTQDVWPSGTAGAQSLPRGEFASGIAAPPTLVSHLRGSWFSQSSDDATGHVIPRGAQPGGTVSEIDPSLSSVAFECVPAYLGAYISAEKRINADFDLDAVATQRLTEALLLAREIRVATLLRTTGSWNSANVVTVAAGAKWNGGVSADPLANVFQVLAASRLPVTHMIMSEGTAQYWFSTDHVRTYVQAGGALPRIIVAKARVKTAGVPAYVWGGDIVLVRAPQADTDLATCRTFLWNGNKDPNQADGMARLFGGGLLTRIAELLDRGPRGGQLIVCGSDEVSTMLDGSVGGLILNAVQ